MTEIYDWLIDSPDYSLVDVIRSEGNRDEILNLYANNATRDAYVCVTAPHEGNNNMFLLRASRRSTFDRWGNAEYEEWLPTADAVKFALMEEDFC